MQNLWIHGQWERGKGSQFTSFNPATLETIWQGCEASHEQVDRAIKSAKEALTSWMLTSFDERCSIVRRFAQQLKDNEARIAETISKEVGKPYWESLTEVGAMIAKAEISIESYETRTGLRQKDLSSQKMAITRHKPHGVFVVLGPYNFPGHLPNGHIVPALLAGNTVVFKPSELTPLTAEVIMRCWQAAELPVGVLNLIQGNANIGQKLIASQGICGVLFTGSYQTGLKLHKFFASHPEIILALEMGGNNPLVVMEVKDHKAAAYHTILSAYITSGQRCTCARRLIVPKGRDGDSFLEVLQESIQKIKIGAYTDKPEPFMGPLISKKAAGQLLLAQDDLIKRGGIPLTSMTTQDAQTSFLTPGLIDVTNMSDRYDVELFGPLLQVIRVKDFKEAIKEANCTNYGLSAGLFSDDLQLFGEFYQKVHAGVINWNQALTGASSAQPFGGIGFSGNHRPSAFYAADYCAYPVASLTCETLNLPTEILPGL